MSVYSLELPGLKTRQFGRSCFHFSSVDSTQDVLANLLRQGATEGTVVLADEQVQGRGRQGKNWQSLEGSHIYASLLVFPKLPIKLIPILNITSGLAICEALEKCGLSDVQMKWPNDVMVRGRKIAGTLSELQIDKPQPALILGFGINVQGKADKLPTDLQKIATTVESHISTPDRLVLLAHLLNALEGRADDLYADAEREQKKIQAEFQARWIYAGEKISVQMGNEVLVGTSEYIDTDGALLLQLDNGQQERILAGQVNKLRNV